MKHSDRSTYNIYSNSSGVRRRRNGNRRRNFVIVCLLLCMACSITDIVLISKLIKHSKKNSKETTLLASDTLLTDAEGNPIADPTADPTGDSIVDPSATESTSETSAAKVQTVDAATRSANLETLKAKVADYLSQQSGRYGVYYINMNNGETFGVNETMPVIAASSIKVAYCTYLYEKAEAGELSLDETMKYSAVGYPKGDLEYGTGTIQNSADGTEYTLREVSKLAITISDNCGVNMVIRRLGGEDAINDNYLKSISSVVNYREKVTYTDYAGKETTGIRRKCALDLAKYAERTYQDWSRNPEVYQPLIDDLCNTEYNWGVPQGVPSDVQVAHKVGFHDFSYNDLGIVFGTEDYVLCIMTESGDASKAQNIMGEVSRMVYEYVESCYA